MIITTTENIAHFQISEYMGAVCSHIVMGTNIFSDIAASFTDFFGGHSSSYQGKLSLMYDEVSKDIESKACHIGANAIVGIRIDFDEISGKDKSMFMVSISGTAVKIVPDRYEKCKLLYEILQYQKEGIITNEEYEYEKDRINNMYKNGISEETRIHLEEQRIEQAKIQEQMQIAEKKAQDTKNAKLELARVCPSFESLTSAEIQVANYSSIPFDESQSLDDAVKQLIQLGKIPEACKFYMDETSLGEEDAIEYIILIYKEMIR
ncbi:YbjQ family protein [Bacteroides finegoldii]|jgi:UPF0145 protein csac_0771|uniref:YbjQ family protein n=1 Tax=Bacteroides finegoldii TaxID=338188 RepID=UPI00189D5FB8|nr:heavy metal-binding domain-containing protein [Bacteroides finegoldii]